MSSSYAHTMAMLGRGWCGFQIKQQGSHPPLELTLAMGMSLLLLLVLSSPVLGLTGRLAEVRRPGLEGPVACTLCSRV